MICPGSRAPYSISLHVQFVMVLFRSRNMRVLTALRFLTTQREDNPPWRHRRHFTSVFFRNKDKATDFTHFSIQISCTTFNTDTNLMLLRYHSTEPQYSHKSLPFWVVRSKQIPEDEMGGACDMNGGFWWGNLRQADHFVGMDIK